MKCLQRNDYRSVLNPLGLPGCLPKILMAAVDTVAADVFAAMFPSKRRTSRKGEHRLWR